MNRAGSAWWRSLEQAADDPGFMADACAEFPGLARALAEPLDRRQALKLMAASLVLGGLSGCDEKFASALIPAVRMPPNIVPGMPNYYATAHVLDGYASGIVVKQAMGRPVKVEGNPQHPASLGATDVFAQATLLDFYDPDRAAEISEGGLPSERHLFSAALAAERAAAAGRHGAGLRILTGTVTSPTLTAQLQALLRQFPEARWIQWDPISRDAVRLGARLAYGQPVDVLWHVERADVVLAIDSDLLSTAPGRLRHAREFASRRNPSRTHAMSRVYALEPTPTLIGSVADHRFIAAPAELHRLVSIIAAGILQDQPPPPDAPRWMPALIADLKSARGRALIHVGADQPTELHTLTHAMNEALAGRGSTFDLIEPVAVPPIEHANAMVNLTSAMQAGQVRSLLIIDSNPVFTAPAAWRFGEALERVPFSVALAGSADETARATRWFVPLTHAWENWGDARAHEGSVTLMQPQALPLHGGLSAHEMLAEYAGEPQSAEQAVRAFWQERFGAGFAGAWHDSLAAGVVPDSASAPSSVRLRDEAARTALAAARPAEGLQILFRPDPCLWDGRYANNPWLQELPRPLTKVVWDNPLLIAPALAQRLNLKSGDRVSLTVEEKQLTAPVWVMPGQSPECITALLGSGRRAGGTIGTGQGVDFYPLTARAGPVSLRAEPGRVDLASTVHHTLLLETPPEEILRHGTLAQFAANPRFIDAGELPAQERDEPRLYDSAPAGPAAWAMSIDLNACIGCNACVIACQAENNIPVVGKAQVLREREMHWLRIDRYLSGSGDAPESFFQPVMCMHCEQAPCENVCPVGATVHDAEGLNVMVYNRCIGTRFCSNNCPYKVRRFNYFAYAREQHRAPASWNPDVTVRARGVMEKCTYCVQRIAAARIEADRGHGEVAEPVTACQAACPTQAITFGNRADPRSAVARRKQSPLDFAMLPTQATQPRTTYEALIRNPNPAIDGSST
jgi:molybdopterin-containing oxidoreductase family iron-sulfur binding subunit